MGGDPLKNLTALAFSLPPISNTERARRQAKAKANLNAALAAREKRAREMANTERELANAVKAATAAMAAARRNRKPSPPKRKPSPPKPRVNRNAAFKKFVREFNAKWNAAMGASTSENRRSRLGNLITSRTGIVNVMRSKNLTASMRAERNNIAKHVNTHIHNYRLNNNGRIKVFTPWRAIIAHNINSKRVRHPSPPKSTYVPRPNRPNYHGAVKGVRNAGHLGRLIEASASPQVRNWLRRT